MKKYIVAAGSSVLILLVVLLIIIITEDKTGPIITFSDTAIVYSEGDEVEALLAYATARDSIDGDVTDSLVVASFVPLLDQPKAKVTFAAKDSSNNITKKELIVDYNVSGTKVNGGNVKEVDGKGGIIELSDANNENTESSSNLGQGDEGDVLGEAEDPNGVNSKEDADSDEAENVDSEGAENANSEVNEDADENTGSDNGNDTGNNTGNHKENSDEGDNTAAEEGDDATAEDGENNEEVNQEDAVITYPRIKLTTNEVKLSRGSEYDALSYVESCEDDINSSNTVWGRIRVVGTFDMDKRGNYVMMYYTTDLDGNKSNREYLWIEVN